MDSSPDLSLKLGRRGSNDDDDSYYMDFAQGIDSDIEEVATIASVPSGNVENTSTDSNDSQVASVVLPAPVSGLDDNDNAIDIEQNNSFDTPPPPLPMSPPQSPPQQPSPPPLQPSPPPLPPSPPQQQDELEEQLILELQQEQAEDEVQRHEHQEHQEHQEHECEQVPELPRDEPSSAPPAPTPPASPPLYVAPLEPISTIPTMPTMPTIVPSSTLGTSANGIASLTDTSTTDEEDLSQITPLPMPILPQLKTDLLQMLEPNVPLVLDDDESALMEIQPPKIKMPPSPTLSNSVIVSPETLSSHHSSPAKTSRICYQAPPPHHLQHQVIDENVRTKMPLSISTHHQLTSSAMATPGSHDHPHSSISGLSGIHSDFALDRQQVCQSSATTQTSPGAGHHLALLYHSSHHHHHHHSVHPQLPAARRPSRIQQIVYSRPPELKAYQMFATTLSALYGKLLVVMGIAFPMAEVISTYIPPSFYEVFYLYLYVGSMLFLFFMYTTLIWGRPKAIKVKKEEKPPSNVSSELNSSDESDTESGSSRKKKSPRNVIVSPRRPSVIAGIARHHYGSFYLRMGAVAFGIGSMIYSGLEFGQYFELERDTKCHNVFLALTPATRMAFIFIQMYFIFLNNEQMKVYRHKIIARFGLMHMIGTNLSVWLNVLIQETKHEILTFYDPENRTLRISHRLGKNIGHGHGISHQTLHDFSTAHLRSIRGLKGPHHIFECRRTNIIGTLVQDASPFLFPCTIEYSLICAAILYVMWRGICRPQPEQSVCLTGHSPMKRSPHHYSVDCARAHKGLFIGILILVLTIISLILFFVLISRPEFVTVAVTEVTITELTLYGTATLATLIGMIQVRHLQYDSLRHFTLDDILLVGGQSGLFLYSMFSVIGSHFTMRKEDTSLVLITSLASIIQTACQTMFILDASRRNAATASQQNKKPGREIVTFLLVANLAMWAISTLEKSRAESHPIQLNFYGLWAWTIITHVSMPLAIFYRFHSTVCLCEIWKRAYKMKPTYM